jgi:DNA-binding transcriptional MerR regulator
MKEYVIGQLAKEAQVKADAIRFYEKIGLMPPPARGKNDYRSYSDGDLKRLKFIVRAKSVGFTLKEMQGLFDIKSTSTQVCEDIRAMSLSKLLLISKKIEELKAIETALKKLALLCERNEIPKGDCPFLDALEDEEK